MTEPIVEAPAPAVEPVPERRPHPDVGAILAIHRDPDGYIAFTRKPDPSAPAPGRRRVWEELFSIRAGDLRDMFPAISNWLLTDAYMTVNDMYRAAPWQSKLTGYPGTWRTEKHLRSLATCYSEVDCGRPGSTAPGASLSWLEALGKAHVLSEMGVIPAPSIVARSGQGCWLYWLLVDEADPTQLPHAWREKIELYKALNRELGARLYDARLPVDRASHDAARVTRVPGSIHRKTGNLVGYSVLFDESGKGFTYTLSELARFLGVSATTGELPAATRKAARPAGYRKAKAPGTAPLRSHGPQRKSAMRAQDMRTIEQWRGGWRKRGEAYPDGHRAAKFGRRETLRLYARFLRGSKADQGEALQAVQDMARNCVPPWPDEPVDPTPADLVAEAYTSTGNMWKIKADTLCRIFGITEETAQELDLLSIKPKALTVEADRNRPTQADVKAARLHTAQLELERNPHLDCRVLGKRLGVSHTTANKYMNELGYIQRHTRNRKAYTG